MRELGPEGIEVITHIAHNLMQDFVGQVVEIHLSLGVFIRLLVGLTGKGAPDNELLENYYIYEYLSADFGIQT